MDNMTSILSKYEGQENRRALGGIYALAGFDYQLRLYLAELVESLAGQGCDLDKAGGVFLEALSDLAETEDGSLVCIQVKRTLTRETLKDAAAEVVTIDCFLAKHYPESRAEVKFELVASKGDAALQWSDVPDTHPTFPTIQALIQQGRLLSPRIAPDPWWRAIVAAWKQLKDPYGFLRFALDRALSRAPTAADAQRIRDDICERFAQVRQTPDLPGQLLTPADFQLAAHPSASLEIGREVTLARLRDRQYMPRRHRLDALYPKLIERKDLSRRDLRSEARVFWLSGRSGVGKSVLLLQAVERLVSDGWRVLWLKGQAGLLEPALRAIADAPAEWWPDFIAIDDLYDRDARNQIDLGRLGEFIDERGHQAWPMILTCGPAEFAESFREDATYRGFDLHLETIETIAADEAEEIEAWYHQRTGKGSQRGPAFSQASQEDNGLFVSLAVELTHGNLEAFAQRFGNRVRLIDGLDEALRLPLALNRLYLRAPYDWLTDNDREKLATLNSERDFSLLEAGTEGQIVRLTHPHLADALYRALRKPANPEAFTNDLVAVFRRALAEHDTGLVSQLLRVFSAFDEGLASERLRIADRPRLARECARIWGSEHAHLALDADGLADAATSWACWSTTMPCVAEVLGNDLLDTGLAHLSAAYKVWPSCWQRLAERYPKRGELFAWAAEHLADPLKISHPTWSFAWERCLQDDSLHHAEWRDTGLDWLQRHLRRPDWHIVWKKLLPGDEAPDWKNDPVLILGLRRLNAESDGPDWAYVFEDLYALATPPCPQAGELATLARAWLAGREDRAEWAHIWRALLAQHEGLPEGLALGDLLRLGAQWLAGREDRAEWAHIWQALLAQHEGLPEGLALGDLLRLGAQWLTGREDRAAWAHIWQDLLAQHEGLPEGLALGDLLRLGAQWLAGRESSEEWGFVCEALLDQQFQAVTFIEHAAAWLKRTGAKPEWPLLAAKFIIAAPLHAASVEFARALTARIKACANNAHWFKTANLVGALPTHIELPSEVRDWLQTLHARTELPAWAEVRHCRNEGLPVKGRVIAVHDKTTTVELDIGLVAVWPSDRDGIRRKKGLERSFFVRQLVPDKGRVIVCTEKPVTLEVNQIYQGSVVKHLEFGLLVNIVGQTGLLHQSHYPDWANLVRAFPVGSQITVEILAFNDKGPELRYADSKPTSNRGLAVGDIYDACVTGLKDYGVFLRIGAYSGLLHISQLPPDTDIPKRYLLGQKLAVQVIQIRDDGKISFALPASAA